MSKIYFAIVLSLIKIKSLLWIIFYRIFGAKIAFSTRFEKKPFILGYLNNVTIGEKCSIHERVKMVVNKEGNIYIGNNTLISTNCNINAGVGNIYIGNNTMIAANSYIINNDHQIYENLSPKLSGHITRDIIIEDNVWIGANCIILKGVKIGEGAIIGAGSIVTKNVSPYSVNIGNPCKNIKFRFNKDILIEKLVSEGISYERIHNAILREMEVD